MRRNEGQRRLKSAGSNWKRNETRCSAPWQDHQAELAAASKVVIGGEKGVTEAEGKSAVAGTGALTVLGYYNRKSSASAQGGTADKASSGGSCSKGDPEVLGADPIL